MSEPLRSVRIAAVAEPGNRAPRAAWRGVELLLVALLALAVRLVFLDHTPHEDELNHVLAARAWLADGTLSIAGGAPYDRAWAFTYLVAGMIALFGDTLVVARLPAVAFGVAMVAAIFAWTRAHAGSLAAWVAAVLLTLSPVAIQMSQWVRFYTLHALLVFLAAAAVYRLVGTPRPTRAAAAVLAAGAAAALALGLHLQVTTAVAAGGIVLGALAATATEVRRAVVWAHAQRWVLPALGVAVVLAAVAVAASGIVPRTLERLTFVDLWAEQSRSNVRFYHFILLGQYAPLWALFPLTLVVAAAHRFRFTAFCGTLFLVAFVFHSLVPWKTERYLFYALPFLFVVWGVAIGGAAPWVAERVRAAVRFGAAGRVGRWAERAAQAAVVGGIVLFAAGSSAWLSYASKMLTVHDHDWRWFLVAPYRGWPDWEAGARELAPLAARADVVLSSSEINSLWALGRIDGILRRSTTQAGIIPEFGMWRKVPVPVISTAESLERVTRCHPTGLIVLEWMHWRNDWGVPDGAADWLEAHATPVDLPDRLGLMAYRWETPAAPLDAGCAELPLRPVPGR